MFDPSSLLTALNAAVDELASADLGSLARDELLELVRGFETVKRRHSVIDHALVAELESRSVWFELAAGSTANLLRQVLRITPNEAKARVTAAAALGPRRAVTGETLGPLFEHVAAAQATGEISSQHASVIVHAIDALPDVVQKEHGGDVERDLTAHAGEFDPQQLAALGRKIESVLNPDGTLANERDHERWKNLALTERRNGSGHIEGDLTPEALEVWRTVLDPLAAPRPAEDGERDPRTPGQRMHDGFLDAGRRLLRSDLPDTGGVPTTLMITVPLSDLQEQTGLARTGHGALISVQEALRLADQAQMVPTFLNDAGGILGYGRKRRLATAGQRLALSARDGGCTFPGCDAPPQWTEVHHIRAWLLGGETHLDNMCLLCGYHHREHDKRGWTCQMIDGIPHWIPPPWIDPDQRPRCNAMRLVPS